MQDSWGDALMTNLIHVYLDDSFHLVFDLSPWLLLILTIVAIFATIRFLRGRRRFDLVKLDVALGGVGHAEFRPSVRDIQIAHQIWTELVTRKAAVPFDRDYDVVVEVYDSWYELFSRVRSLVAEIPGHLVREEESTRELVKIATDTLNKGLRPHLTRWQSKFRSWYLENSDQLGAKSPQELQREFPQYDALINDLISVNRDLIDYSLQLQKVIRGE